MKVALVSTCPHPISLGLRYIGAYLKRHGHNVRMIFMSSKRDTGKVDFSPGLLECFAETLRAADLVGMSLMTNSFMRACALTEAARRAGIKAPIVWGGTHPTVAPDESIQVADMVCVGEGERPLLAMVETLEADKDPATVDSFLVRRGESIARNPVMHLDDNLDELPFPDYDNETHLIADRDELVPVRPELLRGALDRYRVSTTRGCPYSCKFCNNAAWTRVYKGRGRWVRRRSNENVIAELEHIRRRHPSVQAVNIVDDLFFIRNEAQIDEFVEMYGRRVNLPLELDAFPNTITRQKVRSMARLPISLISMGIQSGSPDTLRDIYDRPTSIGRIVAGIDALSEAGIKAEYHYLVSNPFEPEENVIETLRFAATHHRGPAILRIFPLQFYPGTPLYERARAEGITHDYHQAAYHDMRTGKKYLKRASYLEIWLRVVLALRETGVRPAVVHRVIDLVIHPTVRRMLDRRWFAPLSYRLWRVGRTVWRNLLYQPFVRPLRYLRRRRKRHAPAADGGAG